MRPEGVPQPGNCPKNHPWRKLAIPTWRRKVSPAKKAARAIARMRGK